MSNIAEGACANFGRRAFLRGGSAFLVAAGTGFKMFGAGRTLRLKFGVLSDIHITEKSNSCNVLETAFLRFKKSNVDAVVIAGDLADNGFVAELLRVGETWRKVFPDNRREDGGVVEKVFVTGNHDIDGWKYSGPKKMGITREKDEDIILEFRLADTWRKAFDEEYSPMYVKVIKGYPFVGVSYDKSGSYFKPDAITTFLEGQRKTLEGDKPFFYVQHFHPQGTCSAPWVWGQDDGYSTAALSKFPNAVAFSGHSHTPLTDDRTLWRGSFTSIGTASLRYLYPFGGRENSYICGENRNWFEHQMPIFSRKTAQQGQIVSVYDDCMVIERMDFKNDLPAAPDWVVPLPAVASSFEERAKTAGVPQFAAGAKVTVERITGETREKKKQEQFVVSFPNVLPKGDGVRPFDFRVEVEAMNVDRSCIWATKRVYSPHFCWAEEKDDPTVTCVFACSELPRENCVPDERGRRFRFAVSPANCYGAHGLAIRSDWLTGKYGLEN